MDCKNVYTTLYTVIVKQSYIFVLDKCEITVDTKWYSEPLVDLHNLRKSKSVTLHPALPLLSWCSKLFLETVEIPLYHRMLDAREFLIH